MKKATFRIDKYLAVIPHIQNVYAPEREGTLWCFGFKYKSGVFEYFYYHNSIDASKKCSELMKAIDEFYNKNNT